MVSRDLLFEYDVLLVDLYGVIWGGTHVFSEAIAALKALVAAGKKVSILSNMSMLSDKVVKKYDVEHLSAGVHFSTFVTSGDALHNLLKGSGLSFKSISHPKNCFVFGSPNDEIFIGSDFKTTTDLDAADFVYLSIPRFLDEERDSMPPELRQHLYVARTHGQKREWDSVSIEPYIPWLRTFLRKNKPIVIANPDKVAICSVLETPDAKEYVPKLTVRQGLIAETYRDMGGEILAIGKPFARIYQYALERIAATTGESIEAIRSKRIAMIGDSIDTDILGAKNASKELSLKIDSILVLTGVTGKEMTSKVSDIPSASEVEDFFRGKEVIPTHVIPALDLNAHVYF
jgi:HAD superfamily hydrolase (TIGR01450 family)